MRDWASSWLVSAVTLLPFVVIAVFATFLYGDFASWMDRWHVEHHNGNSSIVNDLGLHDTDFTSIDKATATQQVETFLATANHVSVFATGYGDDGAHLVHRNGDGNDGALIINPLSETPQYLVFHFPEQTF